MEGKIDLYFWSFERNFDPFFAMLDSHVSDLKGLCRHLEAFVAQKIDIKGILVPKANRG